MKPAPQEVPQPHENPVVKPGEEPAPQVWPMKNPEIIPGQEPPTVPLPPKEIPAPPDSTH